MLCHNSRKCEVKVNVNIYEFNEESINFLERAADFASFTNDTTRGKWEVKIICIFVR